MKTIRLVERKPKRIDSTFVQLKTPEKNRKIDFSRDENFSLKKMKFVEKKNAKQRKRRVLPFEETLWKLFLVETRCEEISEFNAPEESLVLEEFARFASKVEESFADRADETFSFTKTDLRFQNERRNFSSGRDEFRDKVFLNDFRFDVKLSLFLRFV